MSRRRGRRPGDARTRAAILEAARLAFAEQGLDGASVRGIARAAGVDPALVHHYFGSKRALFIAATEAPFAPADLAERVLRGGVEGVGGRLAHAFVTLTEQEEPRRWLLTLVRSALADEDAADALRAFLAREAVGPVARAIGRPPAELRATLVGALFVGVLVHRHVLRIEPLASATPDEVVRAIGPAVQHYLAGDLAGTPSEEDT